MKAPKVKAIKNREIVLPVTEDGLTTRGTHYTEADTQKHMDVLANLLIQGYDSRKAIRVITKMAEEGKVPPITKDRAQRVISLVTAEWRRTREKERGDDYVVRLAQMEELIFMCRHGVRDPNQPDKWLTRPSRMTELTSRQELHKLLGYYDDRPQLNINILQNQVIQSNMAVLGQAGSVLAQVMSGQLPSPEDADLIEARRILMKDNQDND